MKPLRRLLQRTLGTAVAWSWALNALRAGSNLLLLPVLWHFLPEPEYGMYFVFLDLLLLAPMVDLGLSTAIDRAVGYAMAGAKSLQTHGTPADYSERHEPNYALLWRLLHTTRITYRWLALVLLVLLGAIGTYSVGLRIGETASPRATWLAWALVLGTATFEVYSNWWNVFLRGLNQVVASQRNLVFGQVVKFVLTVALLAAGWGLISVPIALFASGALMRSLARRQCLRLLRPHETTPPTRAEVAEVLRILWPNSWRVGVILIGSTLSLNLNTIICLKVFGLAAKAQYGLSLQLAVTAASMAQVWTYVKWPLISQYQARRDFAAVRAIFRPRLGLQLLTYVVGATAAVAIVPPLLVWLGTDKSVLPLGWLIGLMVAIGLEMHVSAWTTLISTANEMPFLRIMTPTHAASVLLTLGLATLTDLGLGALVLGPALANTVVNTWYWPKEGARRLGTSWWRFMSGRAD